MTVCNHLRYKRFNKHCNFDRCLQSLTCSDLKRRALRGSTQVSEMFSWLLFFFNGWREEKNTAENLVIAIVVTLGRESLLPLPFNPDCRVEQLLCLTCLVPCLTYLPGLFWCLKLSLCEICDTIGTKLKLNNNDQDHCIYRIQKTKITNPA